MGGKLMWTGLTIMLALNMWMPSANMVGSIIMIIGCVLTWMDK